MGRYARLSRLGATWKRPSFLPSKKRPLSLSLSRALSLSPSLSAENLAFSLLEAFVKARVKAHVEALQWDCIVAGLHIDFLSLHNVQKSLGHPGLARGSFATFAHVALVGAFLSAFHWAWTADPADFDGVRLPWQSRKKQKTQPLPLKPSFPLPFPSCQTERGTSTLS